MNKPIKLSLSIEDFAEVLDILELRYNNLGSRLDNAEDPDPSDVKDYNKLAVLLTKLTKQPKYPKFTTFAQ